MPDAVLVGSFEEIGSGARDDRPQLLAAIALCKKQQAKLVIAKLDRLSRNAYFLIYLKSSALEFCCVDAPYLDSFSVGILALVAQKEREMTSIRTRNALAEVKRRGLKKIGNPRILDARLIGAVAIQKQKQAFAAKLVKPISDLQSLGMNSLTKLANGLNRLGYKSARGYLITPSTVKRVLAQRALI